MTDTPKAPYYGYGFVRGTNEEVNIDGNSPEEVQMNALGHAYAVTLVRILKRPEEDKP